MEEKNHYKLPVEVRMRHGFWISSKTFMEPLSTVNSHILSLLPNMELPLNLHRKSPDQISLK